MMVSSINVEDLKVSVTDSIKYAISVIDSGNAQIALVDNEDGYIVGTVTDGDVRRGLLSGANLDNSVVSIMNSEFTSLPSTASDNQILTYMLNKGLHQIPGLDNNGRAICIFLLDDFFKKELLCNSVVIMAGGRGSRLSPLTNDCPKPMLKISGKPMLESLLEKCIEAGLRKFFISVNYLKDMIIDYFGDGSKWGVSIVYLEENKPLGTAGSLNLISEHLVDPMFVLNADVLTRVDFKNLLRFHLEEAAEATICVREISTKIPYGVVELASNEITAIQEKPEISHFVNAGIYVINPSFLEFIPSNQFFDMPDLINTALINNKKVRAFPVHEYWLDVGLPETFKLASVDW